MGELATRRLGQNAAAIAGGQGTSFGETGKDPARVFTDQVAQWFSDSARQTDAWRLKAIESYEFVSGVQWKPEDVEALGNRPTLTINKVLAPIMFLQGVQRQQRREIALVPAAGPGTVRDAEVMTALLKHIGRQSGEDRIDDVVFADKIVTGLGFWKVILDTAEEPEGLPRWERVHPLSIFADPNWFDGGWEQAEYVMHAIWMTRQQAQDQFPEYSDQIDRRFGEWLSDLSSRTGSDAGTAQGAGDSWSADRLFWDKDTQRIRLLETWYKRRLRITVARNTVSGEVTGEPDRVRALRERLQLVPTAASEIEFIVRPVTVVRRAYVLQDLLLDDAESPWDDARFPIFPTLGYYFWKDPFGVVEPMKDPQREKNRRRSTIVEIVQKMPLGGFFNKRSDGAKSEDIRKFGSGEVGEIPYENTPPQRIQPPELPQTLVWLEQQSDRDVEEVSNVHRELLGNTTQKTVSGRAIEARQRGGMTTQQPLLESFVRDKQPAIRFMVKAIQQYMPLGKALRVLGVLAAREQMGGAVGPVTQLMHDHSQEVLQILHDALLADYDVAVDASKPWEATVQIAQWEALSDLAAQFPGALPPEVLVNSAHQAGLISEGDAQKILAHQARLQGAGPMPPGPGAGAPPLPPGPPPLSAE